MRWSPTFFSFRARRCNQSFKFEDWPSKSANPVSVSFCLTFPTPWKETWKVFIVRMFNILKIYHFRSENNTIKPDKCWSTVLGFSFQKSPVSVLQQKYLILGKGTYSTFAILNSLPPFCLHWTSSNSTSLPFPTLVHKKRLYIETCANIKVV